MHDLFHGPRSQNRATFEAVIFDLDGTLVDSNDLHVEAWDRAFRHFGLQFPIPALRDQIGKGSDQYLPAFLSQEQLISMGEEIDKYRSLLFRTEFLPRAKPFPKVRDLLQRIKRDGKRIAFATSSKKDDVKTYSEIAHISDLVDCEATADDADSSKPSPDVFKATLNLLQVPAQAALAVGDTRFDAEAATRIGLPMIGLLCGRAADEQTLRKHGAIAVYKDPADLLEHYHSFPLAILQESGR